MSEKVKHVPEMLLINFCTHHLTREMATCTKIADSWDLIPARVRNLATMDWNTNTDASTITMASIIIAWGLSYMDETSVDGFARDPFSGHWVPMTSTYQACKDQKIILPGDFAPLGKVVWDLKVRSPQGSFYNLGINLVVICDQTAFVDQDWPVDKTLLSYMPELADELAESDDLDRPLRRHIDTLVWFDWVLLHEFFHCLISGPLQVVKETYLWDNCTKNPEPTNAGNMF